MIELPGWEVTPGAWELRRTPLWREIAEGILFQEGDIVEHGEEAEEGAVEDAAARGEALVGSTSLGIGSLRGAAS